MFVTEYATKETFFDGQEWPFPETEVGINATDSVGYGLRLFENTLALLNAGAHAPFIWYLLDEPSLTTKMWGVVALDGREKPAYTALEGLTFPVGGQVLTPPLFDGLGFYGGGVTSEGQTVLGFSNEGIEDRSFTLRLRDVPVRPAVSVQRFHALTIGDPALATPSTAEWVTVDVEHRYAKGTLDLDLSLPAATGLRVVVQHVEGGD